MCLDSRQEKINKYKKKRSIERFFYIGISYFCCMYNKRIPLEEGDYYENEQGYRVFTAQFHLRRGSCCKSGCKHCPYGYDKMTDTFK